MTADKNPYEILGVSESASFREIKSAYKRKARETHPDRGGSSEAFKRVDEAWRTLKNEHPRKGHQILRKQSDGSPSDAAPPNVSFWAGISFRWTRLPRATQLWTAAAGIVLLCLVGRCALPSQQPATQTTTQAQPVIPSAPTSIQATTYQPAASSTIPSTRDTIPTQTGTVEVPSSVVTNLDVPSTVNLGPLSGGVDTGILLHKGETVHIIATGIVQLGLANQSPTCGSHGAPAGMGAADADGHSIISGIECKRTERLCKECPASHAPVGALIGRIGDNRWFLVGADKRLRVPADGELWLGCNDWASDDNSGSFTVDISE